MKPSFLGLISALSLNWGHLKIIEIRCPELFTERGLIQSWPPIPKSKFADTKRETEHHHVNPLAIKKALSDDRASFSLEHQSAFLSETRFRSEALPVLEVCTSAWPQSFQCSQTNRMDKSTDWLTGNNDDHTGDGDLVKSITLVMPDGKKFIITQSCYRA